VLAVYVALLSADLHARVPRASFAGLIDQSGRVLTGNTLGDRYKLVFFGYSQCPDVCPTTLAKIHAVMNGLGDSGNILTPLFVTLDAAADSPQVLAAYTAAFDARIVGVTGDARRLDALSRAYGVYAARHGGLQSAASLNHGAQIYLLAPDNSVLALYLPTEATARITADISQQLKSALP
jgi:protein SCO1/2